MSDERRTADAEFARQTKIIVMLWNTIVVGAGVSLIYFRDAFAGLF